mmetsp:Transcript_57954/g.115036  ORF Transcript_57954/g.115036 Transcript_57954/m.115036 type:complete len:83 (+) Transcript_57954:231-479(+)
MMWLRAKTAFNFSLSGRPGRAPPSPAFASPLLTLPLSPFASPLFTSPLLTFPLYSTDLRWSLRCNVNVTCQTSIATWVCWGE